MVKPEEVEGDHEEQGVPEKSKGGRGVFAARGEAAAGHIETPGHVESQRPEENQKQAGEKENTSLNPEPEEKQHAAHELQPGDPEGDDVDGYLGEKPVIVYRSGEKFRVNDLVQAGNDEDGTENDPGRQGNSGMSQQGDYARSAVCRRHGHVIPRLVSTVFAADL
jgi:hypothetical protein